MARAMPNKVLRKILFGLLLVALFIAGAFVYKTLDQDRVLNGSEQSRVLIQEQIFDEISCVFPDTVSDTNYLQRVRYPVAGLGQSYIPTDLTPINRTYLSNPLVDAQVRSFVTAPLLQMFNAALEDGVVLRVNSAFRAFDRQASIFNNPINNKPGELALAARPGYSEHQLGTTVDVSAPLSSLPSVLSAGYDWIESNSYKYGFILTYPEGSEVQTGFRHEPWHIRYVGKEIATSIVQNNIVFNELDRLFIDTSDKLVAYDAEVNGLSVYAISSQNRQRKVLEGETILTNQERLELIDSILGGVNADVQVVTPGEEYLGTFTIRDSSYLVRLEKQELFNGYLLSTIADTDVTAITKLSEFAKGNCKVI